MASEGIFRVYSRKLLTQREHEAVELKSFHYQRQILHYSSSHKNETIGSKTVQGILWSCFNNIQKPNSNVTFPNVLKFRSLMPHSAQKVADLCTNAVFIE
jgi:hypothetical protein